MFYSIVDLVEQANSQYAGNVAELMIATEYELPVENVRKSYD